MADISVTRSAVAKAMSSCVSAATEIQKALKQIKQNYDTAGQGWKDSKYKEFGKVVNDCNAALGAPLAKLADCYKTLEQMDEVLEMYETA